MEITNYRLEWIKFRKSTQYKDLQLALKKKGIIPPYSTNILMAAFAAGWIATGKEIKFIKK